MTRDADNRAFAEHAQRRLTTSGDYTGRIDGWGGPATRRAFDAAMARVQPQAAGAAVVVPASPPPPEPPVARRGEPWRGRARRLAALDFGRIGQRIGVSEDHVRAVVEVETAGGGFDSEGRVRMLFEPHVFYRQLGPSRRAVAEAQGLAYPRWGTRPYPRDSYPRLLMAMQIDRPAALRSCSWGLGQIMGFNHRDCGYTSAEEMVVAFADDEAKHVEAMIDFIRANNLDDDLREGRWAAFARGYNGPGYRQNGYDTRLAAAYAKWARRPDASDLP
jgi:hypothetical protein